jgi:hypothetical protein
MEENKIEVAFFSMGQTLYLDVPRAEIPRIGETVRFWGESVEGSIWADIEFIITGVTRSYDKDTQELTFVGVQLTRDDI